MKSQVTSLELFFMVKNNFVSTFLPYSSNCIALSWFVLSNLCDVKPTRCIWYVRLDGLG